MRFRDWPGFVLGSRPHIHRKARAVSVQLLDVPLRRHGEELVEILPEFARQLQNAQPLFSPRGGPAGCGPRAPEGCHAASY